jgi:hypothetical protein
VPPDDGTGSDGTPADGLGAASLLGGDRLGGDRLGGDRLGGDRLGGDRLGGDTGETARTTGSVESPPEETLAPAAWDPAPAAAAARGGTPPAVEQLTAEPARPAEPALPAPAQPLSGDVPVAAEPAGTPIFDTVSMWFSTDPGTGEKDRVIDLRDHPTDSRSRAASHRWSSLGDQRWLATNARAAAGPEIAGSTEVGLPRRRPGANLIPSAAAAAPVTTPAARPELPRRAPASAGARAEAGGRADADAVRGRLSSYQRGLTSARRARHLPADRSDTGLFAAGGGDNDPGHAPGEQGG